MQVLNKYHLSDKWPSNAISIMRGTPYGNPFPLELYRKDRELLLEVYRSWFMNHLANGSAFIKLIVAIPITTDIVCCCHPKQCHGHVIQEFRVMVEEKGFKQARKDYLARYNYEFAPKLEGISHINIYSKSKTELGRLCSNFAHTPFNHPDYGHFESMEGFWFWLSTGKEVQEFRTLVGYKAKDFVKGMERVKEPNFEVEIEKAIRIKVEQTPRLKELLTKNHLPFLHYYYYGTDEDCKCVHEGGGFLEGVFKRIGDELNPGLVVALSGSRTIKDIRWIRKQIGLSGYKIRKIIEGGAKGVDAAAIHYSLSTKCEHEVFPADWDNLGKGAGHIRNGTLAENCDVAISLVENNSSGSLDFIKKMEALKKDYYRADYESV